MVVGTHTVCVILDGDGQEIGRGQGGPSNHQSVGVEAAQKALAEAVAAARRRPAIRPWQRPALAWPGWTARRTCTSSEAWPQAVLPGLPVEIVNDAEIALAGGTGGRR